MKQSKKIAITGGIGSGKTYVCGLIQGYGFRVFSCDEISRTLWQDEAYRAALAREFPECTRGSVIDKAKLTQRVFSDREAMRRLNFISHPIIMRLLISSMEAAGGVCFAEVPLLFEGGYESLFDAVIAVRREKSARLDAVRARDGLTDADILARMENQFPAERLEEKACYILENRDAECVSVQLRAILKKIGLLS